MKKIAHHRKVRESNRFESIGAFFDEKESKKVFNKKNFIFYIYIYI